MSMNSELRALLERLGPVRDAVPGLSPSDPATVLVLRRTGPLDRPIDVMKRLREVRVSLRHAHGAINRLAEQSWAVCAVDAKADLAGLRRDLAAMNVEVRQRRRAPSEAASIAAARDRQGLSQREFADLLGFDVRTLQNWEQGRNRPDAAALSLIALFDRAPEVIEELISEPIAP